MCRSRATGSYGACDDCLHRLDPRARTRIVGRVELLWLGRYEGALSGAVQAVKFSGHRALAAELGSRIGRSVRAAGWPVARVVPVPLHRLRRWSRGYDQAAVLAHAAASALGVPAWSGVRRVRRTARQARRSGPMQRSRNVAGAFVAARVPPLPLLLVDDVWTTGATATACRAALLEAGAREVRIAVVARAGSELSAYPLSSAAVIPPSSPPTRTWG